MTIHLVVLALSLVGQAAPDASRLDHARSNYEALAGRSVAWNQLSPQDIADLRAFADALRLQRHLDRTPSQRCFDQEFSRYGKTLTDLQQRLIDLRCRPIGEPLN